MQDREVASAFISHLMSVATDHGTSTQGKQQRLRSNLVITRMLVERWRERITISKEVIYRMLVAPMGKERTGGESTANAASRMISSFYSMTGALDLLTCMRVFALM